MKDFILVHPTITSLKEVHPGIPPITKLIPLGDELLINTRFIRTIIQGNNLKENPEKHQAILDIISLPDRVPIKESFEDLDKLIH